MSAEPDKPAKPPLFKRLLRRLAVLAVVLGLAALAIIEPWDLAPPQPVVNDVTKLNPVMVARVERPTTVAEIRKLVREAKGPVSIGGGRFSMGGQTAEENALQLDLRWFNRVLALDMKNKTVTVEPGITWRQLQAQLDPHDLSVAIMQTYANFTVGGSLSVNVHGRYVGQGPIILSVKSIKVVLADGSLVEASPVANKEIFYGAIGGYGGLGVIVEATLKLDDNTRIRRDVVRLPAAQYPAFFRQQVRDDAAAVFHNGDLYPPDYDTVSAVTWRRTDEPLTDTDRLKPVKAHYPLENLMYWLVSETDFGPRLRENTVEPYFYSGKTVTLRNREASYDVRELEPPTREFSTYVLQEYFVPVAKFGDFVPRMAAIFHAHHVKVLNVSIRHAHADPGSLLAWAREECFAFVIYYKQGTSEEAAKEVGIWTRALAEAALTVGGRWYLPYQPQATLDQFLRAYPRAGEYFALKQKLDPDYKFRNKLWDKYYFRDADEKKVREQVDASKTYARREEQTWITLPEWYIVFSPDEYAQELKKAPPSAFPYFSSIAQFWRVYHAVIRQTWAAYPFNWGYHAMICVIGTSYSAELALKGIYEETLGRLTEWISGRGALTPEMKVEAYQQWVAQDYVDFIRIRPWYEYPFYDRFKKYWAVEDGPHTSRIRRWERRCFFSAELLIKAGYGWVIGLGTAAAYDPEELEIGAVLRENGHEKLVSLKRYQDFTNEVPKLAAKGVDFVEIAGNKTILMTLMAPRGWTYAGPGSIMYEWPVLTDAEHKRVAVSTPVEDLARIIRGLPKDVSVDHIFDY